MFVPKGFKPNSYFFKINKKQYNFLGRKMVFCSIFRPTISILRSSISSTSSSSTAMVPLLNKFTKRTHNCGELRLPDVGKRVSLYGWVASKRSQKNNAFLVLRDAYGKVQAFVPDKLLNTVPNFHPESSICVEGTVVDRGRNRNSEMATGDIEVFAERIELLNPISEDSLPLFSHSVTEMNRLAYRYLDLRWERMQEALRLRAKVISQMRRFLEDKCGFVDIQTPTLANFTAAGGASEFLVPFNENGECFCLPQSPQIYKQLLMCGSMDRYYQIAICYRDEKITPFRQPEFTQLDLELSFTDQESVMELVEQIVCESWPQELEPKPIAPFPRISYSDAMNKYGTDKPDIRIQWEIFDVPMNLKAPTKMFIARGAMPYLEEKNLTQWKNWIEMLPEREDYSIIKGRDFVNKFQQNNEFLQKHDISEEDAVVICSAKNERHILKVLGRLRNYLAGAVGLRQSQNFSFIWVHKFPLFTWSEENGVLESSHHPFTAPINEHLDSLLKGKNLESIEAQHYDLVLNGVEIGGGSIRIHDAEVQRHILDKILKIDSSKLQYLITALGYGAPPHGGFALGLDRYLAILNEKGNPNASIRSVIAFPKGKFGQCFMTGSPTLPSKDALKQYGLSRKEMDNKKIDEI